MQGTEPVQTNDTVEFRQNPIQDVHNVIATVVHMTGIQTDTHIVTANRIDDGFQLFKSAADFTALACHGFQQDFHGIVMAQCVFQSIGNVTDTGLRSLSHVTAGMEIVEVSGQRCHAPQVIFQHFRCKGTGF